MKGSVKLFALPIIFLLFFCSPREQLHRETRFSMSTSLTITVSGSQQPDWDELFEYADRAAAQFDHRIQDSPIWTLNRSGTARLQEQVLDVIRTSQRIASLSKGAFDPTILPLTALWSFETGGVLPKEEEILNAKKRVNFKAVQIGENGEVFIPSGFGMDLGGIAKGAVADQLADFLSQKGYNNYLIEAGGDIVVSGLKKGGRPWVIAIRHPRKSEEIIGLIPFGQGGLRVSIVTSGDYERFFEHEGKRYHHILNPRTGFPAAGVASVTVITTSCAEADALATAAFVMGPEKGLHFLENLPQTEGLLIEEAEGKLRARVTGGFPLSAEELNLD